jgi:hypothetical protein
MHSLFNGGSSEILGYPVVTTNVPQNNNILAFNNGQWVVTTVAGTGGLDSIGSVGTGENIVFGEFAGTAFLKSISGGTGITITPLAQQLQISVSGGGVLPTGGVFGDILYVNSGNSPTFGKSINVNNSDMIFDNTHFQITNTSGAFSTNFSVLTDTSHGQTAKLNIGAKNTNDKWQFYYDPSTLNLILTQVNNCINKDFTFDLGAGSLIVAGVLNMPNLSANSFLKLNASRNLISTGINLDDLSDVILTSPTTGQVLGFNGVNWINTADTGTTLANVGVGTGQVYKNLTGTANLRTLLQGQNMSISTGTDEVTIATTNTPTFGAVSLTSINSLGSLISITKPILPTAGMYDSAGSLGISGQFLGQTGSGLTAWGQPNINNLVGVGISGAGLWDTLAFTGSLWINRKFYTYPTFSFEPGSITVALDNMYVNGLNGATFTMPTCNIGDAGRRIMIAAGQRTITNIAFSGSPGLVVNGIAYTNFTMNSNNLDGTMEFIAVSGNYYVIAGCSGKWTSAALGGKSFNATMMDVTSLQDTNISGPTNGQVLTYNSGTSKWINSTPSAGVTSFNGRTGAVSPVGSDYNINSLAGTAISSPTNGQIMSYNGTNWINSSAGASTNIYNTDGTLTGNRTLSGASLYNLTLANTVLNLVSGSYANVNSGNATDGFVSFNTSTNGTATMPACYTSKSFKSITINNLIGVGDWTQFYSRTYTSNLSINLKVSYSIRGTNDSTSATWLVVGSIEATPQNTWLCVPPLACSFSQGNIYNLEAYYNTNTMSLRIIKTYSGSNAGVSGSVIIMDNTSENGSISIAQSGGSGGTLATAYYPASRRVIQNNNGTGATPSIIFNWISGYQLSIEVAIGGGGGPAGARVIDISLNGTIVAFARGVNTSGVGMCVCTPTNISVLNNSLVLTGSNTLTFTTGGYTNNQVYSITVVQTQ